MTDKSNAKVARHPLAIAWEDWLTTDEGQECNDLDTLTHLIEQLTAMGDTPDYGDLRKLPAATSAETPSATYVTTVKLAIEIVKQSLNGDDAISKLESLIRPPESEKP